MPLVSIASSCSHLPAPASPELVRSSSSQPCQVNVVSTFLSAVFQSAFQGGIVDATLSLAANGTLASLALVSAEPRSAPRFGNASETAEAFLTVLQARRSAEDLPAPPILSRTAATPRLS